MGCCCGASAIDPNEALESVRNDAPEILIEGEIFKFAFAFTRDQVYFTNYRLLFKDKKGLTGSSVGWRSIPWNAIKAFAVQTAGTIDLDVEIMFWATGVSNGGFQRYAAMPSPRLSVSFKKGGADLFALQQFVNQQVFDPKHAQIEVPPQPEGMEAGASTFMSFLTGDAQAIDPKLVETQLRSDPPVLLADETVDMAFRCGRDTTVLTSRRLLHIDVQGLTGSKVQYMSYVWNTIKAFAVQTAGTLDFDCELTIWTGISHMAENKFQLELRSACVDIMAIQRYFSDKVLGQDTAPPAEAAGSGPEGKDAGGGWQAWLAGDMRMLDAVEQNQKFHEEVRLLQSCETCEMAFKAARDMVLFTTKRLILIDPQGLTGKKVSFTSLPWSCVQAFAVQSPGAFLDKDSEMMLWTDVFHDFSMSTEEGTGENDPPKPIWIAEPGLSFISVDFHKDKVDLGAVGRYLAERCSKLGSQMSNEPTNMPPGLLSIDEKGALKNGVEMFLGWLTNDYRQVDPEELDAKLHSDCSMLLPNEKVRMGFLCGRDTLVLTTHRAMKIDKQGFTGKKVLYLSLPYTKIQSYEVESAGTFDLDARMSLSIKAPWYAKEVGRGLDIDFGKGRADIVAVNKFLSEQLIGAADGTSVVPDGLFPPQEEGLIGKFLDWIGGDSHQISAGEVAQKLSSDPAMLLPDETVDLAFKCGRDLHVFTTRRLMKIDVQGWTGKKVSYVSLPLKAVSVFEVTGAASHPFDTDAEVELFSNAGPWKFDVKKGSGDIMSIYTFLNKKCIMDRR
jgi:hypothetical protein